MSEILGIIGAGDLGQQIANFALKDNHFKEVVFFDDYTDKDVIKGCKVLGKLDDVLNSFSEKKITHLMIGIGYKHMDVRAEIYDRYKSIIPFATIVHSSCWIDPSSKIGEGVIIYPNSTIDANVVIENNVLLNIGCAIAHDTVIKSHCFLSPSVALAGFVVINERSILGINCTIIDNVTVTSKTQIGAGAVVVKDVVQSGIYIGVPAKILRKK
ncbi:acetyltransferase [Aquimarina litoralis]|uniref:acetyltransferase n=1 Tax=Aquimarina litoralis TaxID=584605 RepID=UPI001C5A19E2|nr:acetyltransferase [Aquimarina litoralis]MBW1297147.1 hypothetical protein [Aquimarina litoralis]